MVERWLREAGAPEPWARPDKINGAVELLFSCAELSAGLPDDLGHRANLRRAHKAVRELRAVLPSLIAFNVSSAQTPPLLNPESGPSFAAEAVRLQHLLAHLVEMPGAASVEKWEKWISGWHLAADILFRSYGIVVGSAKPTKGGPAVRFVRIALIAVGHDPQKVTLGAIEAALRASQARLVGRELTRNSGTTKSG